MKITLTPKQQQQWLAAHVARGDFPSIEDALGQLVNNAWPRRATIWHGPNLMSTRLSPMSRGAP